jgi:molybdenum cofactor cytidylyltransferase
VLAAGCSSRFRAGGGAEETKLLAKIGGRPMVAHVVDAALESRARPVIVVVGFAGDAVAAALAGLPATIAVNPDFETGIASSLGVGLASTPPDADGAVVLLGDMPKVDARLIDALIAAFEARREASAVAPVQKGRRGNPILLGRGLFDEAMRLKGDEGARRIVAGLDKRDIVEVEASGSGSTFDVDTPSDLLAAMDLREKSQLRSED